MQTATQKAEVGAGAGAETNSFSSATLERGGKSRKQRNKTWALSKLPRTAKGRKRHSRASNPDRYAECPRESFKK